MRDALDLQMPEILKISSFSNGLVDIRSVISLPAVATMSAKLEERDCQASPSRHRIHGEIQSLICPLPFLRNPIWAINGLWVDRQSQRDLLRPRHPTCSRGVNGWIVDRDQIRAILRGVARQDRHTQIISKRFCLMEMTSISANNAVGRRRIGARKD